MIFEMPNSAEFISVIAAEPDCAMNATLPALILLDVVAG